MRRVIVPASPIWELLWPADRARVVQWARGARPPAPAPVAVPLAGPPPAQDPVVGGPAIPQRVFSEMRAEMLRGMRFRTCRDAGAFITVATLGASFAIYARPPITSGIIWAALAWLVAVAVVVRYLTGRAKGRGIVGTPENNAAYFGAPENYAVGGLHSATLGGFFGVLAMLAALLTKGF